MFIRCILYIYIKTMYTIDLHTDFEGYGVFVVVLCGPIPSGGWGRGPTGWFKNPTFPADPV